MTVNESRYREAERRFWDSVGVVPTERYLELGRTGAAVRVQEVGDGEPIVVVHGASNSGVSWAQLVARLDGFRCIVLDRPGCGLSAPIAASFDDVDALGTFAEGLIVDVLDALGLESAHVIATSFGGYVAVRTAAAHPDRVRRMMLCGWSVGAPMRHVPLVMRVASLPGLSRLTTAMPVNERMVRSLFRRIGLRQAVDAGSVPDELVTSFTSLLRDTRTMRNEIDAGPRIITMRGMVDSVLLPPDLLGRVVAPTYFLWGAEDPFGGPQQAREFTLHFPDAELELVPSAGHCVWIDDPAHAAATARRFLSA